jgi:hypothetical protein
MGIGLLIDDRGDDMYKAGASTTAQGGGVFDDRKDGESIGILVDGEGRDVFSEGLEGKRIWRRGDIGSGIDSDGKLDPVWPAPIRGSFKKGPKLLSQNSMETAELFSIERILPELEAPLSSEASWDNVSDSLAEKGPQILPVLCQYLKIKDVTVHRVIEEAVKKLGQNCLEDIHGFLQGEETNTKQKKYLLYVLGDIENKNSRDVFQSFLTYENDLVQAMALRGFYKLQVPLPSELKEKFSASSNSAVRRYLGLALQASDDAESMQLLCEMLGDENFHVRYAAYKSLIKRKQQAIPYLEELRQRPGLFPYVYRMADDIMLENNGKQ